jgi:hypothetical protein
VLTGLPNGMTVAVSWVAAATHFAAIAVITAKKHLASAFEIVSRKTDAGGVASIMAHAVSSYARVKKTS